MTMSMRSSSVIAVAVAVLALAGCSRDPVTTVPGHLQPGPSIVVAQQALGGAGPGNNEGMTIGAAPWIDWSAPNIPVMQDGVVDVLYFWPRESKDGEALREGHYVYVKVAEQSFTAAHAHTQRSLLNDAAPSPLPLSASPASTRLRNASGPIIAPPMPYSQQAPAQTRVSVVEIDPRSGQSTVVGTQTVPGSAVPSNAPAATQDSVLRMLENFNAAQQGGPAAQPSGASGAPRTGTPGQPAQTPSGGQP